MILSSYPCSVTPPSHPSAKCIIIVASQFLMRTVSGTCVASEPLIYACPGNAPYYNLRPCIPTEPSQCPRGFACMLSRLIKGGKPSDQFTHLCCDSSKMNFADCESACAKRTHRSIIIVKMHDRSGFSRLK